MKCFHCFSDKNKKRAHKSDNTDSQTPIKSSCSSPRSIPEMYQERAKNLRVFTYSELSRATCNFNKLLKIGEGGFGCVYKARLKNIHGYGSKPTTVAIKKLNSDGHQGHKQWITEVQFLGIVNHPNYVKLIGYCAVDGEKGAKQRLLVYEYVPNKSLDDHLFNRAIPPLPWERRLNIMLGAAQGLAHLHEELEIQVIYRDFKASNVLLDEEFRPKLSDFGFAREGPSEGNTHVSTNVVGTHGYAAPDYVETGRLTSKSDVWSYGVVLYEILTGRRSLETGRPKSEQVLVEWIKQYPLSSSKFGTIMDPRLENKFSLSSARKVAKLADMCLSKNAKDRPRMSSVVESLKEIILELNSESDAIESPPKLCGDDDDDGGGGDNDEQEEEEKTDMGLSESAKRRMEHLAKLGENLGVVSRRRFMEVQA